MIKKYKSQYVGRAKREPVTLKELDTINKKNAGGEVGLDDDKMKSAPKPEGSRIEKFASDHPWLAKAGAAVKERSTAIAQNMQRPNSYRGVKPNTVMDNPDPFGMSRTHSAAGRSMTSGSGFSRSPWGPADNLGIGDPFGIAPRPNLPPKPTRKSGARTIYHPDGRVEVIHATISSKKKRKRQPQNNFADPFHIPRGLRDIF